ncbi:MAG: hypothetical protein H0T79_01345 [Deltaproteobacteria bacterium]|nr:hypothetical protein [Deltaproteobacteria bacterium]
MRCVLAGLCCVLGCNPVFGLDSTKLQDAPPPGLDAPDAAPLPSIRITQLVVSNNPDGSPKIDRDLPLDHDPQVQVAADDDALEARPYVEGRIEYPAEFEGRAWRLVATLDGGSHEYQWTVDGGHITESPKFGHRDPKPVPPGSSYQITPAGLATNHQYFNLGFFTSGVWTDVSLRGNFMPMSSTYSRSFPDIRSVSEPLLGPFGMPESARGDWQLLVEYPAAESNNCFRSIGAAWQQQDLVAGGPVSSAPAWLTTPTTGPTIEITADSAMTRFPLESIEGSGVIKDLTAYGYVPNAEVPAFNRKKLGPDLPGQPEVTPIIDRPLMVTLVLCNNPKSEIIGSYVDVPELQTRMTRMFYGQLTSSRSIGDSSTGPIVTSAIQGANIKDGAVEYSAPMARNVRFDDHDLGLAAGAGSPGAPDFSETIALGAPRLIELTFGSEALVAPIRAPDDYVVTLFYVGAALDPVRVFHVTSPRVRVDSALFDATKYPSRKFIFQITSRRGLPMVSAMNDWSVITYPYASSSAFTYAFTASP